MISSEQLNSEKPLGVHSLSNWSSGTSTPVTEKKNLHVEILGKLLRGKQIELDDIDSSRSSSSSLNMVEGVIELQPTFHAQPVHSSPSVDKSHGEGMEGSNSTEKTRMSSNSIQENSMKILGKRIIINK